MYGLSSTSILILSILVIMSGQKENADDIFLRFLKQSSMWIGMTSYSQQQWKDL